MAYPQPDEALMELVRETEGGIFPIHRKVAAVLSAQYEEDGDKETAEIIAEFLKEGERDVLVSAARKRHLIHCFFLKN